MVSYRFIGQPHIHPVVVEEEDAVTAPVLEDGVDESERQAFVTPWINEKECRNHPHTVEQLNNFGSHLLVCNLRFVLHPLDARQFTDRFFKLPGVFWILVVE